MREPIMQGRGYYNQHSALQARSAAEADGMLERALAAVTIPAGPPTIADFGSSQGHNSMRQIALMLDRLTERIGRERDVRVVHTDLPHCDYTSLFVTLETSPDSYRRGRPYAFASAIGHSFYDRLLPEGSLTLGWSSFALHWMSALPMALREHILAGPRLFGRRRSVGGGRRGRLEEFPGASRRGTHDADLGPFTARECARAPSGSRSTTQRLTDPQADPT
jgi:S-adenosylmethionine-dependent carboxyl methyltransferase